MHYTLGQAAKAAGVAKTTIADACKSGKISYTKNDHGAYQIDAAELHRVYPSVHRLDSPKSVRPNDAQPPSVHSESSIASEVLRLELEMIHERMAAANLERERERQQLTDQIEDLRRRLDTEGEERRRLTAILTDQRPKPPDPAPDTVAKAPEPAPAPDIVTVAPAAAPGWWSRLTGRG